MRKNVLYLIVVGTLPLYAMEKMETFLQDTKGKEWNPELQQQFDSAYQDINLKITLKKCKPNSSWKYKEEFKNRLFERCNHDNKIGSKEYQKYQRFLQYVGWSGGCVHLLKLKKASELEKCKALKRARESRTVQVILQEWGPNTQKLWGLLVATKEQKAKWFNAPTNKYTEERMLDFLQSKMKDVQKVVMRTAIELDSPTEEMYQKQLSYDGFTEEDKQRQILLRFLNRRYRSILHYKRDSSDFTQYVEYPYGRICPPYSISLIQKFATEYPPDPTHCSLDPEKFIYRLTDEQVHKLYKQRNAEVEEYKQCMEKWTAEKRELLRDTLKEWEKIEAKDKKWLQLEELSDTVMDIVIIGGQPLIDAFGQAQKSNPVLNIDNFIDQLSQKEVRDLYAEYERDKEKFPKGSLGPITDDNF